MILAWGIAEGIIVWRGIRRHRPPIPGDMLATSALFVLLAMLAEYQPARAAAVAFAFGIDLAVLLKIVPGTAAGGATAAKATAAAGGPAAESGRQPLGKGIAA